MKKLLTLLVLLTPALFAFSQQAAFNGAWRLQNGTSEIVWIFTDGYSAQTTFDKTNKRFISTWGGPYMVQGDKLAIKIEFNTVNAGSVGQTDAISYAIKGGKLTTPLGEWTRLDDGSGAWRTANWWNLLPGQDRARL
jgi:hypothetical protein